MTGTGTGTPGSPVTASTSFRERALAWKRVGLLTLGLLMNVVLPLTLPWSA